MSEQSVEWIVREPKEEAARLPAYREQAGEWGRERGEVDVLRVWCGWCDRWHQHGMPPGHRSAHCNPRDGSPYERLGYELVLEGEFPSDVPHGVGRWVLGCVCVECRAGRTRYMADRGSRGRRPWPKKGELEGWAKGDARWDFGGSRGGGEGRSSEHRAVQRLFSQEEIAEARMRIWELLSEGVVKRYIMEEERGKVWGTLEGLEDGDWVIGYVEMLEMCFMLGDATSTLRELRRG